MAITRALLEVGVDHEFWIAISNRFPETIEPIRREFVDLIPPERIVVFSVPEGVSGASVQNSWRSRVAEALREHFLASLHPDVIFVPSLFEGFHDECVTSIGRQAIPTVVTVHDLIPLLWPETYITGLDERECYNRKLLYLKRADYWLAVSDSSRREACEFLSLPEDRVLNTSEAVGDGFGKNSYSSTDVQRIYSKFGLTKPFVLFAGAIEHRKNVDGIIKAFGLLPNRLRRRHQVVLVGAADDQIRKHLLGLAKQSGLSDTDVVFTDHTTDDELIALYNLCEVFVYPSFHEGFGLPILEAMACGAAVIGSDLTSIPEVIGRDDALFNPHDPQDMARLIEKVLTDKAFRTSLREYGPLRARTFTWTDSARRALVGLESAHAIRAQAEAAGARSDFRCKLAYVASLPPRMTPAARRAAVLLPELAAQYDIEIVSDQDRIDAPLLTANFPMRSVAWFRDHADDYDRIIYDIDGSWVGAIDMMTAHPGVIILDDIFIPDLRPDLEETSYLRWVYDLHGLGAVVVAAERGREAAAARYPLVQAALEVAAGVIVLSDVVQDAVQAWFQGPAVGAWRNLASGQPPERRLSEAIIASIEAFARAGAPARLARLLEDIVADCRTPPTETDLVSVARSMAANQRPIGRPQLLIDISSVIGLDHSDRRRGAILGQIAALVRNGRFRHRVEPIYSDGERYRYAQAFAMEALGLNRAHFDDEYIKVVPGDLYLGFIDPTSEYQPRLSELRNLGAKILFSIVDEPGLLADAMLAPALSAWIEQVQTSERRVGVWCIRSPISISSLNLVSAVT